MTAVARLVTQYFATGTAIRRNASSPASTAAASRIASAVAASDSSARSASSVAISGCSASTRPNAERWAAWCVACATAWRMSALDPSTQSSRVAATISTIVRTPRPSSPSRRARVPSSSISAEALDRLPSLSFSRCSRRTLREPSGSTRGTTKQVSPPGAWASMRKTSLIGAEQNHLWPVSRYQPSPPSSALVVLARTSEPPCFSVMAIPARQPALSAGSLRPGW